jgi:hypothetical protein
MIRLASHLVVVVLASTCAVQHAAAQEAAPPPLHEEGVALDVARHRVVLYGGTRAEGESYVRAVCTSVRSDRVPAVLEPSTRVAS